MLGRSKLETNWRAPSSPRRKAKRATAQATPAAAEDPLWQALKAKRLELAREQGVPPYVIFHDSTLLGILQRRPASLEEMAEVSGVGQAKLERYGAAFLGVLRAAA